MYTTEQIVKLLQTNDLAVERALIAIFNRQTNDEKVSHDARWDNGVGFSGAHSRSGCYMAKWCLLGKHLTGKFLQKGRIISLHYVKQLVEISNENERKKLLKQGLDNIRRNK